MSALQPDVKIPPRPLAFYVEDHDTKSEPEYLFEAATANAHFEALEEIINGLKRQATEARAALLLYAALDDRHANCEECEGSEQPEACAECFPYADAARCAMRKALDGIDYPDAPQAELQRLQAQVEALLTERDHPETEDFFKGVPLEAAHQRARWSSAHDAGKTPADWFWLVGYLAGKCLAAHIAANREKALHHTISTAAALANWHLAIREATDMRPGIADCGEGEVAR